MKRTLETKSLNFSQIYCVDESYGIKYGEVYIYLNFFFFFISRISDHFFSIQYNSSQIFLAILTLVFIPLLPLIYRDRERNISPIIFFIIFIIAASPLFYLAMDQFYFERQSLISHGSYNVFSYISYSFHALSLFIIILSINIRIWLNINRAIFFIGILISLEALFFYYVFPDFIDPKWISPKSKFISTIIGDNIICGIIAFIMYISAIINFRLGENKVYLIYSITAALSIILLLATGERSTIIIFIVFNIIFSLVLFFKKLKNPHPKLAIIFGVILIAIFIAQNPKREVGFFNSDSGVDRIAIMSVGVKTIFDALPFGVGGNMSSAYFKNSLQSNDYFSYIKSVLPSVMADKYSYMLNLYLKKQEIKRVSSHNTYIDFIADLGILGILTTLMIFYSGFRVAFNFQKNSKNITPPPIEPMLWIGFYFSLLASLFFTSHNSNYWFIGYLLFGSLMFGGSFLKVESKVVQH